MKKGWYWPWFIGALLLATAAGQGVILWAATHDSSVSIEPDYYNKGVAYDSVIAQRGVNARLGWQVALTVGPLGADGGKVTARLTDSTGAAITGARVHVTAINNVDGDRHLGAGLVEGPLGYAAHLAFDRGGLWEFRLEVTRGKDHFTSDARVDIGGAQPPAPPAR